MLLSLSINAQNLTGRIVSVTDGDTVILLDDTNTQHKIRLWGIDCPEKKQDFGNKATEKTKELTRNKKISVDVKGTDRYGRILGIVFAGSLNVNEELLKCGLAWKYKHTKFKLYDQLESEARGMKLNIWSVKNPVNPSDFRKK